MWPLNTSGIARARRPSAPASRLAASCAACLIVCALAAHAGAAPTGAESSAALRDKDVRRAEKALSKLRLLDEAAAADDAARYRALASKLYPGLFVLVAEMRPSDLHTDISTAVFLAEKLNRVWFGAGDERADCERERRDIYRPLCLGLRGGSVRRMLSAKARLHARWAEAVVKSHRGERDAETSRALSEIKAARAGDLLIAARVVETLKPLEAMPAASKECGGCADALDTAGALLSWLPRGPAFQQLSEARRAYADGLFWHQKVQRSKRLVVNVNGFDRDPLKDLRLDAEQVGGVAAANWKSAARYTRMAENSMSRAPRR